MPHCYIGACLLCFSKQCIKIFVKGVPGIPHFSTSHNQMNITSLIAKEYVYQDLFSEDGYARNGGFNILYLDRHGGFIGAHKFSAFTESLGQVILHLWDGLNFKFYQSLM